jgi:hypothetical protein
MNAFVEHHQGSVRFAYSCFDRILLNAVIQVLQHPASVVGFLKEKRQAPALTPRYFRSISCDYHTFVETLAEQRQVEIVQPPKDVRREDWVEPFYKHLHGQPGIAVILKSRENARLAVSFPRQGNHIEFCHRFVWQYYFYLQDRDFGRMFLRICPYFPFNARVCLNGHEWLACRLHQADIHFQQCGNAFRTCDDPARLQELSDQFAPEHILACAHRWLAQLVPFFTDAERRSMGFGYRLFASQVEYCTNLIFDRRAALDRLHERLLDLNRAIGSPDKISIIFGRRITKRTDAGLRTQVVDHDLGNPVIRSQYKSSSIKQYVRDHLILRTEATSYDTRDLGIAKSVEHLPELREKMSAANDRYLDVQQDILETFVDRGQLEKLRQPTVSPSGRRTPGLKLDDPRLLAVMHALVCFTHLAGAGCFRTTELHKTVAEALGKTTDTYTLGQLRYDLAKLRAKELVERIAGTQTYRLPSTGYRLAVLYLKLFHRIYAPLVAGTLEPVPEDCRLPDSRRSRLDRLYAAVDFTLVKLCQHVGLNLAA